MMPTNSDPWDWTDARAKLTDCHHNHACDSTRNTGLPLRLIDLQADPAYPDRIRLVLTSDISTTLSPGVQYAALSYYWGATTAFTTTPTTIRSRMGGFAISEVPATLGDTVLVVQWLGIRYLWIVSLCILQGGRDDATALADWRHEAARMHLIYGNYDLCIVSRAEIPKKRREAYLGRDRCAMTSKQQQLCSCREFLDSRVQTINQKPILASCVKHHWLGQGLIALSSMLVRGSSTITYSGSAYSLRVNCRFEVK